MIKIDLSFFANSIILLAIIVALTGFKVFSCKPFTEDGEDFSLRRLLLGLASNLGILLLLSFVYYVGSEFGQDLAVIQIGDAVYTIQAMLNALIILAIGVYGIKLYRNAAEFFGLVEKVKEPAVNDKYVDVYQVPDFNVGTDEEAVTEEEAN